MIKSIYVKLVLAFLITFSVINNSKAQVYYKAGNYGNWFTRIRVDSIFAFPIKHSTDTIVSGFVGAAMYCTQDSSLYLSFDGKHYTKVTNNNTYTAGYNLTLTSNKFAADTTQPWIFTGVKNKGGYYSPDTTQNSYITLGTNANLTSPDNTPFINLRGGKIFYEFNHLQVTDQTGTLNTGGVKTNDIACTQISTYNNQIHTINIVEAFNAATNQRWGIFYIGQWVAIAQKNTVLLSANANDTLSTTTLVIRKGVSQFGDLLQFQDTLGNIFTKFSSKGNLYLYQAQPYTSGGDSALVVNSTTHRVETAALPLVVTGALDFPSTSSNASSDLTLTVAGAADGDAVYIGVPSASATVGTFWGFVSSANTVTIRFHNTSGGSADPASGTFKVIVRK